MVCAYSSDCASEKARGSGARVLERHHLAARTSEGSSMRRFLLALVVALVAMAMVASPAGAITYGEPDSGEHPYVGFMIFFDPNEPGWFSCSGTLLDANTFLTAGHCTFGIGTDGEVTTGPGGEPATSGGTDVWVTFNDTEVLAGFPARADYPTEEALYDARSAWLDANPDYISGTAYPHPDYDNFSGFPVNFDVGIVELDQAAPVTTFGVLAPLGTAEELAGDTGQRRNSALVENVGYGIQSVQPKPMDVETRYKSTSRIVEVNGNIAQGGNLHTLNNPSAVGGRGGTCFGDSGGPVLVNNTNQVIAVVSFGFSPTCHGADYSWRVDTQDSYDFILPFLN
jgi:Trypsin